MSEKKAPAGTEGECNCPCTDMRPLDDPCTLCGHPPFAPSGGSERMAEAEFERRSSELIHDQDYVAEARRARQSEAALRERAEKAESGCLFVPDPGYAALKREKASLEKQLEFYKCALGPPRHPGETRRSLQARAVKAEADRDRLAKIIEGAPHAFDTPPDKWCRHVFNETFPCTCWKAAAMGEEK